MLIYKGQKNTLSIREVGSSKLMHIYDITKDIPFESMSESDKRLLLSYTERYSEPCNCGSVNIVNKRVITEQ